MDKCQICNKDLFQKITFENLFKHKQITHNKCVEELDFNNDTLAIPIDNNFIYYDFVFNELNANFNVDYLEFKYLGNILLRNLKEGDWSIIIFYDNDIFEKFNEIDYLVFFALSKVPFLFISLIEWDLSFIVIQNI